MTLEQSKVHKGLELCDQDLIIWRGEYLMPYIPVTAEVKQILFRVA